MWIWILNELSFVKNYFKRLFNKLSVNYFYLLNEWTKVSILSDGNKVDTVLLMGHAIRSDSLIQLFWQFQVVFDLECKNSSDMQQEKIAFKHLTQIGTFTIMKYFICLILYMKQANCLKSYYKISDQWMRIPIKRFDERRQWPGVERRGGLSWDGSGRRR